MSSKDEVKVDRLYNLIIRVKDYKNLPNVETYVGNMHSKGYFKNLIDEGKFTVEEIKKLPISSACEIFFRKEKQKLETGDIIIFKDTGDFQIYLPSFTESNFTNKP